MKSRYSRRTFIKNTTLALASVSLIKPTILNANPPQKSQVKDDKITFESNPSLKTIKKDWPGNKLVNDRFVYDPIIPTKSFSEIIKWKWGKNPYMAAKKADNFRVKVIENDHIFDSKDDCIVWMGHSSFFIRIGGINILTDPVYFDIPFVPRLSKLPCNINRVKNIDYLLLSHDHRDHFDVKSIQTILKNNPNTEVLMSLRTNQLLSKITKSHQFQEAGWYQQYQTKQGLQITYLPAKHWCKRGIGDLNKHLWGSFMIEAGNKTLYFAGDTAYDTHFKEIAKLFPNIDICFMPVGAYKPPHIMKDNHTSPEEAVQAFIDLNGKMFIPMHYGTFDLSDEPAGEPVKILSDLSENGILQHKLTIPAIGEIITM
jgi:L-ascorbate metabolism protein UlaG (beta-lactamase superfamily)